MYTMIGLRLSMLTTIIIAGMVLLWCVYNIFKTKQESKSLPNNKSISNNKFPMTRLVLGTILLASRSQSQCIYNYIQSIQDHMQTMLYIKSPFYVEPSKILFDYSTTFLGSMALGIMVGLVPMLIAYIRNTKNANKIYWFAFATMWLPFWWVWFTIAMLMAIFDKKIDNNTK